MLNGILGKLPKSILLTFAGSCMLTLSACPSPPPQEKVLDTTLITIHIPAKISNDVLSITLPKCALDLNIKEIPNTNILTSDNAVLTYNIYSYSGNLNNIFECEKYNPTGIEERNELRPIYPLADGQPIYSGYDYFTKFLTALGNKIIEERPFVQKRIVDNTQEMLLVNGMPKQTTPFKLTYFKYNGSINDSPSYHYRVATIIQDKFFFQYEIIILVPENRHGHNLPNYNTDFAEEFRNVIQANGNVLDHPELIQGFVDNNERVVKFINEHSIYGKK